VEGLRHESEKEALFAQLVGLDRPMVQKLRQVTICRTIAHRENFESELKKLFCQEIGESSPKNRNFDGVV
jgi:hypothetical protein